MAIITCWECKADVSSTAVSCPRCGAILIAPKKSKLKWWVITPVAVFGAFLLYGALIPDNVRHANEFRRVCDEMVKGGLTSRYECERTRSEILYGSSGPTSAPSDSPGAKGVTSADIEAALEDGRKKAREEKRRKPQEWPAPPASLSGDR